MEQERRRLADEAAARKSDSGGACCVISWGFSILHEYMYRTNSTPADQWS
jgi:hypothetical protein